MKTKTTIPIIKMLGITVIAVAAMIKTAFCQEPAIDNDLLIYSLNISSKQQVKLRLPKDIRSGDVITGSVIEEKKSTGGNKKNSSTLEGMVIEIEGKQTKLSQRLFSFIVPAGIASLPFLLKNAAGKVIQRSQVTVGAPSNNLVADLWWRQPTGGLFNVPPVAQPGQPLTIPGPFDGNAANTTVAVGGQPCEIIAESPRGSYVAIPQETTAGVSQITIEEKNKKETSRLNIINLDLSANKPSLLKGEKTTITVRVVGLEGLDMRNENSLKLRLENQSPQTIGFSNEPGNVITKDINAGSVKDAKYEFSTEIVGVTRGGYRISAIVAAPKDDNDCVKKYQDCMAQVKADKDKSIKKCQEAGGTGVEDCIAQVNTASAKLEQACLDDFLKCRK